MEFSVKDHVFYNDKEFEVVKIVNKAGKQMLMCMPCARMTGRAGAVPRIMCSTLCIPAEAVRPVPDPATRQAMR